MTFAWPHLLWIALAPLALLAWEVTRRRRTAAAPVHPKILRAQAGDRGLEFAASSTPLATSRRVRPWLCAGLVLAIVALARPQWGRLEEPVFDQSREIVLAIDLSRSMLAQDVKPSRLARAKLLIQSLLEKLAGERVGMIVFSGTAFLQSPLSSDYEILREFLPALGPDFLPQGGSNYTALLETALESFNGSNAADRFLIVLSDGEATDDEWKALIEPLKKKGIRVIGLGIGTGAGAMIPDGADGFVKDERGAVVLSKLESGTLDELARVSNGAYRDASTWIDLATLLKQTVEAGQKGQFVEKHNVRLAERFQWPLAFGLWCLLASLCYEFPVRPRPRDLRLAPQGGGQQTEDGGPKFKVKPVVTATAAAVLCLLSSVLCFPSSVFAAATLAKPPASPGANPSPLGQIVSRLAQAPAPSARDWAEFARETVTWGSHVQSEQQPVPEGPVRDALGAVDLGSRLDPKTADWPKLREELAALLKKPEDEKKDEDKNQQDKNQDQQNQDQKKNDEGSPDAKQQDEKAAQDQKDSDQKKPADPNSKPAETPPKQGESAFGDMKKQEQPPPPPPGDTQKVGGAPEKKEQPPEAADPALALPLQKLDQLRNQDSPARLFELMEGGEKKPTKKTGKDW